jgi:hypothetical protein
MIQNQGSDRLDPKLVTYWTTTALFCVVVGFSGASHFSHAEDMVEAIIGMGYPLYFMTIIGLAKMASYLLRPTSRRVKMAMSLGTESAKAIESAATEEVEV